MGLFRGSKLTGRDVLLAAMQEDVRDIPAASYGADGQQYLARLSDDETAYVVYRETFLGWYPEGCAVSASGTGAGPWEAYGSTSHLGNAGHDVADEVDVAEVSGFWVDVLPASWAPGGEVVVAGYQDYDHGLSNAEQEAAAPVIDAAQEAYAATLRESGYVVEDWLRYDGVRLGLFVMGSA
jgi:hypothetical protein